MVCGGWSAYRTTWHPRDLVNICSYTPRWRHAVSNLSYRLHSSIRAAVDEYIPNDAEASFKLTN